MHVRDKGAPEQEHHNSDKTNYSEDSINTDNVHLTYTADHTGATNVVYGTPYGTVNDTPYGTVNGTP